MCVSVLSPNDHTELIQCFEKIMKNFERYGGQMQAVVGVLLIQPVCLHPLICVRCEPLFPFLDFTACIVIALNATRPIRNGLNGAEKGHFILLGPVSA